jgi:hypothetical protein
MTEEAMRIFPHFTEVQFKPLHADTNLGPWLKARNITSQQRTLSIMKVGFQRAKCSIEASLLKA